MEDGAKRRGRSSAALTKKFIPLSFAHSCECANVFWLEFHAISHFVFVLASLTARADLSAPINFGQPSIVASMSTVPEPQNGSSKVPRGGSPNIFTIIRASLGGNMPRLASRRGRL